MSCRVSMRSYVCQCDDYHTYCDVTDIVIHWYRCVCCHLCDDTDTVAVMSNIVGEMSGIVVVFSWKQYVWYHIYWIWCHKYTGCDVIRTYIPSAIGMWEGPWICCLKWNGHRDTLTQKEARFSCSGLNAGSSFISQDEGMSEYPVETLEKALVPRLIWTGGLISLWNHKRHTEFSASKGDDAWLFLKIDRNHNITVPTRKWTSVSCINSRSIRIFLPSLV